MARFLTATLKVLAVFAAAFGLATAALLLMNVTRVDRSEEAGAEHAPGYTRWIWQSWQESWWPREVQWQNCQTTEYEKNIFWIGFNNWTSRWGNSSFHTYVGYYCGDPTYANMLRLRAVTAVQMEQEGCGGAFACFKSYVCKNSQGQYYYGNDCRSVAGTIQVIKAEILFDYVLFNYSPVLGPMDAGKQMHLMIHEQGHAMSLEHHWNCEYLGTNLGTMSQAGCKGIVDNGSFPNDVCRPDIYYEFGSSRC